MVAAPLNTATRFAGLGNFTWYWVPTIADPATPLRTELDAGTDITGEVMGADGWTVDRDTITANSIDDGFPVELPGRWNPGTPKLSVFIDEAATTSQTDIRGLLKDGLDGTTPSKGFAVRFDHGDVTGSLMTVYPVAVKSVVPSQDDEAAATVDVNFRFTGRPRKDLSVPA